MSTTIAAAPSADTPSADAAPLRWHHQHPVRVYWEDTDAGGIVFYGNYLKFMERARTEWFSAALGVGQEQLRRSGQGMFVVTDTQLRYLRPARLDDRLVVTVAVAEVGRASVSFAQTVRRGDTVLCEGRVRVGWVMPVAA
ncbi:YbgC/FadM family acyl-CoA thioesterase, partial [Aquabacterium sp.]|uniref:YbgC/FadM family acyl-CoA thioesterase n=1 Tax=Aquabacterium sp. TaxID=1872578 RepID=UPI0025B81629